MDTEKAQVGDTIKTICTQTTYVVVERGGDMDELVVWVMSDGTKVWVPDGGYIILERVSQNQTNPVVDVDEFVRKQTHENLRSLFE